MNDGQRKTDKRKATRMQGLIAARDDDSEPREVASGGERQGRREVSEGQRKTESVKGQLQCVGHAVIRSNSI